MTPSHPKQIVLFEDEPCALSLVDRPLSTFVNADTGDVLLNEGWEPDCLDGAVVLHDDQPRFETTSADGPASEVAVILTGRDLRHTVGLTTDADAANSWIAVANRVIAEAHGGSTFSTSG